MERAIRGTAWRGTSDIGERRPARFLGSLSEQAREELLSIGSPRQYPPGAKILVEGGPGDCLVLLETGYVKVTRKRANGHEALIAIRASGDVVGEMAVIDEVPRSATVTAGEDIDAYVVQRRPLRSFLYKHPEATLQIVRLSNRRLRSANSWRIAFGEFTVPVRLARVLTELAENHGESLHSRTLICIELTQAELAALVGAQERAVQQALAGFREAGIVETSYREMAVLKPDRLRAIGLLPPIGH
ncbi:Crp/Fnr family transcriptional regulator [Streptomyces sp. SID5910]|uniref:Crp/Fnr family transcriptional regulator n=1 Tax=Streptomyces sp. SID5910 TaxID=2690312 RepID=UPI0013682FE9|nr:Crp/Fnr family transcriptional regulator [Streptomyces sp. SID5910]MYR43627.1 cyclic nucleotide-binding domain-containing protein [Streptomyces sp. SID5910]